MSIAQDCKCIYAYPHSCNLGFPRAWEIEWSNELSIHQTALAVNSSAHVGDAEDESDNMSVEDEDDEDDDDDERTNNDGAERQEGAQSAIVASDASQHSRFTAFSEFLEFLQLGCGGSPLQGYPTIVVVLSTIPASVRAPLPLAWSFVMTIVTPTIFIRSSGPSQPTGPNSSLPFGLPLTDEHFRRLIDWQPMQHSLTLCLNVLSCSCAVRSRWTPIKCMNPLKVGQTDHRWEWWLETSLDALGLNSSLGGCE